MRTRVTDEVRVMNLDRLLADNEETIAARWLELILETYPTEAVRFMNKEKDPFQNPVGGTFARKTRAIFDKLLRESRPGEMEEDLEAIVKIRSVQEFSPSQAVGFIFLLKRAAREVLAEALHDGAVAGPWMAFESRIDELALAAFDLYMGSKERMFEIRARELKRSAGKMMEMLEWAHRRRGET